MGVCIIEQRRQARKFFDFACPGIGAAGADAMAGRPQGCVQRFATSRLTYIMKAPKCNPVLVLLVPVNGKVSLQYTGSGRSKHRLI